MRRGFAAAWAGWLLVCVCGICLGNEAGREVSERDYDAFRTIQVAGLADRPKDMSPANALTRYELAVIVGRAVERVRGGAYHDSITIEQRLAALEAMQLLLRELAPELQRLNVSVVNAGTLVRAEIQKMRPGTTDKSQPSRPSNSPASPPVRATPRESPPQRTADDSGSRLLALARGGSLSPEHARLSAALSMAPSTPLAPLTFQFRGGDAASGTSSLLRTAADIPVGGALRLASSMSAARNPGPLPDSLAWRTGAVFAPGRLSLGAGVGATSDDPLINALAGMPVGAMNVDGLTFGGDLKYRGPLGLTIGGRIEGIQAEELEWLLGRYSTTVGLERPGDKLSLSLDLARSTFFYDPATAVYSAQLGVRYHLSRSVRLQLLYNVHQDNDRALGVRNDLRAQNFMAGQVSIRW